MTTSSHAVHHVLARLLSAENLTVVHDASAGTAAFNTETRQLTLPVWPVSETTYSMLLLHEVAHALWTPTSLTETIKGLWPDYDPVRHQGAINLFEDLRIDALAQAHWSAAARTYALAHDEMMAEGILTTPAATEPLPVRVLARSRGVRGVVVQRDEQAEAEAIASPRDFAHVVALARQWAEREEEEETPQEPTSASEHATGTGPLTDPLARWLAGRLAAQTQEPARISTYVVDRLPEERLTVLHAVPESDSILTGWADHPYRALTAAAWKEAEADAEVMAAAFRVHVNARRYAQARRVATGRLDPRRLHAYRYSDRLFTTRTVLPSGMSHGLLLAVDQSGSMAEAWGRTRPGPLLLQLVTLTTFCRLVRMPYRVVTWTAQDKGEEVAAPGASVQSLSAGFGGPVSVVQIFSHTDTGEQHRRSLDVLGAWWAGLYPLRRGAARVIKAPMVGTVTTYDPPPPGPVLVPGPFSMGQTPLLETLLRLPDWARALGDVERRLLVVLTDGVPTNAVDWRCRTLTDPARRCTVTGPPASDRPTPAWDSPLWQALCDRVRLLTGGVLIGYHIDATPAARTGFRPGGPKSRRVPPGDVEVLGRRHGFDICAAINGYVPDGPTANTHAFRRPFLTQMGRLLAQAVLSEDSIVSQEH